MRYTRMVLIRHRKRRGKMPSLFRTKNFSVTEALYRVKGIRRKYEIITKSDTVLIIPILSDGRILMEKQWRYPVDKYIYELPAGTVDKGEPPKKTAIRELKEETGYTAKSIKFLFKGYPAPGLMDEMMYFYLATGLKRGKTELDKDEVISLHPIKIKKAISMVKEGKIVDTKTIAALLYYSSFLNTSRL